MLLRTSMGIISLQKRGISFCVRVYFNCVENLALKFGKYIDHDLRMLW